MDNLTHSLVGLAAAKAGMERWSPGATAVCVLAANAPDIDILAALGGRWFYLHNHRGITHSIVGTLALALLIPALFYAADAVYAKVRRRHRRVKFGGLLLASLILGASHPLMDWTNNYGVRPLLPWSGRWYYGDLCFIADPWIWLTVGGASFLLTSKSTRQKIFWSALALLLTVLVFLFPLENAGLAYPNLFRVLWVAAILALIFTRGTTPLVSRFGSKIALAALALVIVYWGGLALAHRAALSKAEAVAENMAARNNEKLGRVAAMPVLADPFRWQCAADTDGSTYRFYVSLTGGDEDSTGTPFRFEKPRGQEAAAVARASLDERARVFLDFARFPAESVEGDCLSGLLVEFADLRYTEPSRSRRGTFALNVAVDCDQEREEKR
ncbi:MAG: metal-dependent hydrolase [Acidobacteriota bacterium]|nr:metal-dependent hydrolase [Acidobacteriota bacterium]